MSLAMLVRIGILVYGAFAAGAVFLIWRNAGAEDAVKNVVIAFTSITPLILIILPYMNPESYSNEYSVALIYDSETDQLAQGFLNSSYASRFSPVFGNNVMLDTTTSKPTSSPPDAESEQAAEAQPQTMPEEVSNHTLQVSLGLDLIEKGIVQKLVSTFPSHWDMKYNTLSSPLGKTTYGSHGTEWSSSLLSLNDLTSKFSYNELIITTGVVVGNGIALPEQSTFEVDVPKSRDNFDRRVFRIKNDVSIIEIQIRPSMGSVIQHDIPGIVRFDSDTNNRFRYWVSEYRVSVKMTQRLFRKHDPRMETHVRFFNSISTAIGEFDWKSIEDEESKRTIEQAAISILEQQRQH